MGSHLPFAPADDRLARLLAAASLPLSAAVPVTLRAPTLLTASAGAALTAARRRRDPAERPTLVLDDDRNGPSRFAEREAWAVVRITGWPTVRGERWQAPVTLVEHYDDGGDRAWASPVSSEGVLLRGDGPPPRPGARLAIRWIATAPRDRAVPDGFSERVFLGARGLSWRGRITSQATLPDDAVARLCSWFAPLRTSLHERLLARYPAREAALLTAVLLGERSGPRDELRQGFTRLGLAHLFAVSGLHVGILAAFVTTLLQALRCPSTARTWLTVLLLWAYVALTGAAPSTVRAAAMATLLLGGRLAGARPDPRHGLLLVFWATQVWSPASLADPGLRLSFLAVGGILIAVHAAESLPSSRLVPRGLRDGLAVSLGAQTGTAPAIAAGFGFLAPWSPLVNLAAVPVFGAAVWLAVLGLVLSVWEPLAAGPTTLAWLLLRALEGGTALLDGWLGRPPAVSTWGVPRLLTSVAAVGLLAGTGPRRRALGAVVLLGLPWLMPPTPQGPMRAVQFDIGQGDAAALLFPDGRVVLIDTGPAWDSGSPLARDALPWLRRRGVRRLAGVVLSHAHADHDGAAAHVAPELPVAAWWLGGRCKAPPGTPETAVSRPAAGDTLLHAPPWALVCLGGGVTGPDSHENDRSLAVGLFRDGRPAGLWTGDQEAAGEAATLRSPLLAVGAWDVFKAGHHGSRTSSTPEFLARVQPGVVLVSCGIDNRHRHPSHGPFMVGGEEITIRRTDLEGSLIALWEGPGAPRIQGSRSPP